MSGSTSSSNQAGTCTGRIPEMRANRPASSGPARKGSNRGPLQFPIPKRLPLGPLMDFGYENEVLFPFQVNVVAGAPGRALLHAKVDWLVCRGSCIPEKTELEITRPIGAGSGTVQPDQNIWARIANKLPARPPAGLKIGFVPTAAGFRMTVNTGQSETEASFFPASRIFFRIPRRRSLRPQPTD